MCLYKNFFVCQEAEAKRKAEEKKKADEKRIAEEKAEKERLEKVNATINQQNFQNESKNIKKIA